MAVLKTKMEEMQPELANRCGIVFQHVNVRQCIGINLRKHLNVYGWEVFCHRAYSSDLDLSDLHLFTSNQISMKGQKITFLETVKYPFDIFITNNPNDIFK